MNRMPPFSHLCIAPVIWEGEGPAEFKLGTFGVEPEEHSLFVQNFTPPFGGTPWRYDPHRTVILRCKFEEALEARDTLRRLLKCRVNPARPPHHFPMSCYSETIDLVNKYARSFAREDEELVPFTSRFKLAPLTRFDFILADDPV